MIDFLNKLGLFPEQASTMAARVDGLFTLLFAVTTFFSVLIAMLIVIFAIKFRQGKARPYEPGTGKPFAGSWILEVTWTVIPFIIAMVIFAWGASIYFAMMKPPEDAIEVFVVGRQWMWKMQHMEGRREINELHVPVGRAVKLTMTSEDVIHSFYVPAFRMKFDALPGRYTTAWFNATKEGEYHLFCTEYCGTQHSRMIGRIVVMPMADYQQWLKGGSAATAGADLYESGLSVAVAGERLFERSGCKTCHATSPAEGATAATGPPIYGLYGSTVTLGNGDVVKANDEYLRTSILDPMSAIVKGYRPMMPTYAGRLSEEDILRLVTFIKSRAGELGAPSEVAIPGAEPVAPGSSEQAAPSVSEPPAVIPVPAAPPGGADQHSVPPSGPPAGDHAPAAKPRASDSAAPAANPHARAHARPEPRREES